MRYSEAKEVGRQVWEQEEEWRSGDIKEVRLGREWGSGTWSVVVVFVSGRRLDIHTRTKARRLGCVSE